MRTEVFRADSIQAAAERILVELMEGTDNTRSISSRNNVIYFDGWGGLGASAVLRAVAQRLAVPSGEAPAGLKFDQIIHVDCSKWESMRVLQPAIAEHLELPATLMEMFERQDEDDDFEGKAAGLRSEIPQVLRAMHRRIQELSRRFLVILHNGGNEEIDLSSFGFPLSQYLDNRVLWTFQGRLWLKLRMKVDDAIKSTGKTDVFLSVSSCHEEDPQKLWSFLLHQEAAEVVASLGNTGSNDQPSKVVEYFLYMLKLSCIGYHFNMDYDMTTHSSNYWMCDAVIQKGEGIVTGTSTEEDDDGPWHAANALQLAMPFDVCHYQNDPKYSFPSQLVRYGRNSMMPCEKETSSPPYGFLVIPAAAIPNADMFQDFNKVSVLKVSRRTFSFSSPPFIYCRNLKFLWIDHCQDQDQDQHHSSMEKNMIKTDGARTDQDDFQRCFQRLLVLDVRYTCCDAMLSTRTLGFMTQIRELNVVGAQDWDIGQLQGQLPNIRKLRVTKSRICCKGHSENGLFSGMSKMELLDFSGNRAIQGMANLHGNGRINTSNNCLETVIIIDGCVGIQKITFRGCAKLKNLLLSGSFEDLCILDFSGTAVKTLDLNTMTAPKLDELYLADCKELCAIQWPPEDKRRSYLHKLHIDTTRSAALLAPRKEQKSRDPSQVYWFVLVRDIRFTRSLMPLKKEFSEILVHVEISSPAATWGSGKFNDDEVISNNSIKQQKVQQPQGYPMLQETEGDGDARTQYWRCPGFDSSCLPSCYIHVQDQQLVRSTRSLLEGKESATDITISDTICDRVKILHVHQSLSITSIPALGSRWGSLVWCRVEQCPELECVFTTPRMQGTFDKVFSSLETFWASRLPKARYIWTCGTQTYSDKSFDSMRFLHVDFCPRLEHVLQLDDRWLCTYLSSLVTLEIVWCSNLRVVFTHHDVNSDRFSQYQFFQSSNTMEFPSLKHIHLHELPMLQAICIQLMLAPKLETVKIRGCWSLTRLPDAHRGRYDIRPSYHKVHCDCEKEWWDMLEWYTSEHYSMYRPRHPMYNKKTLLRGTVLT